jgi:hypothetical protein
LLKSGLNLNKDLKCFIYFFAIFSLPVPVAGYEPLIIGLCIECSTPVLKREPLQLSGKGRDKKLKDQEIPVFPA